MTRKRFLKAASLAATGLAAEALVDALALKDGSEICYPVRHIPVRGLEESLWTVQVTDLHVGSIGIDSVGIDVCRRVVDETAEVLDSIGAKEERTILTFTGDGLNSDERAFTDIDQFRECVSAFDKIPSQLRFVVPGNHEIYYEDMVPGADIHREYERLGYEVMGWRSGDHLLIKSTNFPMQIVGTPDFTVNPQWYEQIDEPLFANLDWDKPTLWMTHNASPFDLCGWGAILDQQGLDTVVLAGHTHGGQVSGNSVLQRIGESYALKTIEYESRFLTGVHELGEHVRLNVCNGLGSAATQIRTAERQVGILELTPAG
jgi:predicted MPP superfamily phosphohydrolase